MMFARDSATARIHRRVRRLSRRVIQHVGTGSDIRAEVKAATKARQFTVEAGIGKSWNDALVAQRALERGLEVSGDPRGRLRMSNGKRVRWYDDGKVSVNFRLAKRIVRNKEVAGRLLRAHGVRAPASEVFTQGENDRAWAWGEAVLPLVLKPTNAERGNMVFVGVDDRHEFDEYFDRIAEDQGQVLVEEFVPGIEHRLLVVGGSVVAATRRMPAHVVGDGRQSVSDLIHIKNQNRAASPNPIHRQLKVDYLAIRELARQRLTLDSIPGAGEVAYLRSTSNTHFGGDALDATDDLSTDEIAVAERAARVIGGLRVAGLDVLLPRDGRGSEPCIIEVNSAPNIAMHHFPWRGQVRDAAGSIVSLLFPSTAR